MSHPGYPASVKASRNEGEKGMGLHKASHAEAPQGKAAAGKDHRCQGNKRKPKFKHGYGITQSVRAGNEKKILTASDGKYKGTAVKSR